MKTISREKIIYSLDPSHPPVLEIKSGEEILFQTYDARTGTIQSESDLLDRPHPAGANPATGPVFIHDAEPGDSLKVEILNIDLANAGFLAVKKGIGLLSHMTTGYATRIVPIKENTVHFNDHIHFPARPMVGVIGTAPKGKGIETGFPGPHGGNMDNRYVTTGTTVYLPVSVPGALLALGDVHASMGDGEITMVGLEICADVTVRIQLLKNIPLTRPRIETPTKWITTGDDMDPSQALRIASEEMITLLREKFGLNFDDAYMLMSARADVQVCQICDPSVFPTTARAVFPKL